MEVEILARQQLVDVGIAAGAQQVVDPAAVAVRAVAGQRVVGDGHHGAQIRQRGPDAVVRADVGLLELPRAGSPHALARIVQVPHIEVRHLRAFQRDDAENMAGGNLPGVAAADGNDVRFDELALRRVGDQRPVEIPVHIQYRTLAYLIRRGVIRHGLPPENAPGSDARIVEQSWGSIQERGAAGSPALGKRGSGGRLQRAAQFPHRRADFFAGNVPESAAGVEG
ncbi:hypothetical protein D9M72_139630 [compost metagenome]